MSDSKLVYSTDPKRNQKCPQCRELVSECTCPGHGSPGLSGSRRSLAPESPKLSDKPKPGFMPVMRLEKNGRGGKMVTLIEYLPPSDNYLIPLEKLLKSRSGSGGTHYNGPNGGVIEIQGDKRDLIRKILFEKGIQVKG